MKSWPTKKLGELVEFLDNQRKPISDEERQKRIGPYPYYGANGQVGWIDDFIFDEELVLLAEDGGYFGSRERPIAYRISGKTWVNNHAHVLRVKPDVVETGFIHYRLMFYDIKPYITGSTRTKLNKSSAEKIKIPLPPFANQKQIVGRLDKIAEAQKLNDDLIQKSEELFQSLLHSLIRANSGIVKKLGEIAEIIMGQSPPSSTYNESGQGLPFFQGKAEFGEIYPTPVKYCPRPTRIAEAGDILMSVRAPVGNINLAQERSGIGRGLGAIRARKGVDQSFLYFFFTKNESNWARLSVGSTFSAIRRNNLENLEVSVPPLETQKQIVEKLASVQNYKKQLLEQKIKLKELFDSVLAKSMNPVRSKTP